MNRNWIISAIVLAGVALLATWIAHNTYWDTIRIPTSLKGEAASNPFYSRQRLAEALGATTEHRHALGTLPEGGIVVLSHWHWSVIDNRRRQLEEWVEAGGRLILDHTLVGGEKELQRWSGIARKMATEQEQEQDEPEKNETQEESPDEESEPSDPLPELLWANDGVCGVLLAQPISLRDEYHVCGIANDAWLTADRKTAWELRDKEHLQAARVNVGKGSVTVLNATPFGNRELLEIDHALLFADVTQLTAGDEIVFLSEEKRASLLALMWRYGAPVVTLSLVLLALALWRGAVRLGPLAAAPAAARRSIGEQIRGTGQFALRFGGGVELHAACVRALHETAQRRIPGYSQLDAAERVARIAQIADVDADTLSATVNHTGSRRRAELRNAVMVIEYTRRRLSNATRARETS
ncbi:hypothetical protein HNQ60_004756 [Povalibacter uvarum]|uniref:DUF4350 domain-containing protein n=1 Tax=Povalibacter uvarum TaxID=732238 RepID=A0A841HVN2_9GAMM|nr:DUF4350 domain-containing protein [Povalibacter uvarum]MBB6095865.1 hypothetical protein [Povalibacter uvarum]